MATTKQPEFSVNYTYEDLNTHENSTWDFYSKIFSVAGLMFLAHWRLENQYWPHVLLIERLQNPWWLVQTPYGLITIGRRKKVWQLDWSHTKLRKIITTDEVTKNNTMVHAWDKEALLRYVYTLNLELAALEKENQGT